MDALKKVNYIPPLSRRFGKGVVVESVALAGWKVGWRDTELEVIVTSVRLSCHSVHYKSRKADAG